MTWILILAFAAMIGISRGLHMMQTDMVIDEFPLARTDGNGELVAPPSAAPSVESMLMLAIERGVDPANMERLVALHERVMSQRAKQAFAGAMKSFRAKCPAIVKNREALDSRKGDALMYRFADLSEITKIIDPILSEFGLTYTWDTDVAAGETTVTCTVSHVSGHEKSSKFTCKASGTSIMSSAQVAASGVTFGRRYSLTGVLGLTIDDDDDGRRMGVPREAPPADPNAPKVAPRAERAAAEADDGTPRVVAADLNDLFKSFCAKGLGNRLSEMSAWAQKILRTDNPLAKVSDWGIDALEACRQELEAR